MSQWLIQLGPHEWAVAFMPGYPLVIAALHCLGIPFMWAALGISNLGGPRPLSRPTGPFAPEPSSPARLVTSGRFANEMSID